jgi:hypothetical protein
MPWRLLLLLSVIGCFASGKYMVVLPGEQCPRATQLAFRSMTALGYRVTAVVEPSPVRPGRVDGVKRRGDGTEAQSRVRIECEADGVRMQPVEDALVPSNYEFSRSFGKSVKTMAETPDPQGGSGTEALEVLLQRRATPRLAGAGTLVRITVRNDTDRPVLVKRDRIVLVTGSGDVARTLSGRALEATLGSGKAATTVREALLDHERVPNRATIQRYLVFPEGSYTHAQVSVQDVETGESDGFVVPLQ